jgi:hypothetical protein
MRDTVAEFDEDYKSIDHRILGFLMQLVATLAPFSLVLWIGADLGKYYAPMMSSASAYGLAYTLELGIASGTVAMGRAFEEIAGGKGNWGKTALLVGLWLLVNASTAFGIYLVVTNNGHVSGLTQVSMIIRVCAIAIADLLFASILMFKGRSLQKHIESIKKRASSITELSDAQRSIEEADKNAALREQQLKATLRMQEQLTTQIGQAVDMVMRNILDRMDKALKDDDDKGKSEGRYGRK